MREMAQFMVLVDPNNKPFIDSLLLAERVNIGTVSGRGKRRKGSEGLKRQMRG